MENSLTISSLEWNTLQNKLRHCEFLLGNHEGIYASKVPHSVFKFAFDQTGMASLICNGEGHIIEANMAAAVISGYTHETLKLKNISDLLVFELGGTKVAVTVELLKQSKSNFTLLANNGIQYKVTFTNQGMYDTAEKEYFVFNIEDITAKQKLENLLESANQMACVGAWEYDPATSALFYSKVLKQIIEVPRYFKPTLEYGINLYKGEYREKVAALLSRAMEKGISFDEEFIIVTAKGNERWVRAICTPEMLDGQCISLKGTFQDIHDKKLLEMELHLKNIEINRFINNSLDIFTINDKNGIRKFINNSVEHVLGYTADELTGKRMWDLYTEADKASTENIFNHLQEQHALKNFTNRVIHKNGTIVHIEWTSVWDDETEMVYSIGRDITLEINKAKKQKKAKQEKAREIQRAFFEGEERQKKILSLELHDNICQILSAGRMFLGMYIKNNDGNNLSETMTLLEDSIRQVRELSHSIASPKIAEEGLIRSVNYLIQRLNKSQDTLYSLKGSLEEDKLPHALKVNLYRIIQEQINNIIKHSKAKHATIILVQTTKTLQVEIADDGIGFDAANLTEGIGLTNMKTRVTMFNGKINIVSDPGKGCCMTLEFML